MKTRIGSTVAVAISCITLNACSRDQALTAPSTAQRVSMDAVEQLATLQRYTYTSLGTLGSPSSGSSAAFAINPAGQVVGATSTKLFGASHAFVWQNGQLRDLGALGSSPYSVSAVAPLECGWTSSASSASSGLKQL